MAKGSSVSAFALMCALGIMSQDAFGETEQMASGVPLKGGLEEIVVTAEKHQENLQKSPVAVTALTEEDLRRDDIRSSADLVKEVPGLAITATGANPLMFMRGVGGAAAAPYGDPAFAYNVDGVNYSRPQGATGAFYDIARVEVLKGPQGTLYGRNTASGAFNIYTNDPVFKYQGEVGASFGNYNDFSSEGMINVPVTDQLALRAAVKTERHDGYLSLGYNDADDVAGRVKALYQANNDVSIKLTTSYFHKGGKGNGDVPLSKKTGDYLNPSDPWQQILSGGIYPNVDTAIPSDGHESTSVYLAQVDLDWRLGFADLAVTPAFVQNDHDGLQYDGGFYQNPHQHSDQYSFEARLSSLPDSVVKWLGAVYYLDEHQAFTEVQQISQNVPVFPTPNYLFETIADPDVRTASKAVYGQASYPILDWLRVTAGARYTADTKAQQVVTTDGFRSTTATFNNLFPGVPITRGGSKTWHIFNWKVGLDADITPTSLVYATASTGTRPGGFDSGSYLPPFNPEKLTAYAIGSKNRFFDNRLQVNAEAFYYYYKNLQGNAFGFGNPPGFGPTPSDTQIAFLTLNVPASHVAGVEVSLDYLLTDEDELSGNVSYLHGRYDNYTVPAFPPTGQVFQNYSGLVKDHSPLWSGNLGYQHTFDLASNAEIVASIHSSLSSSFQTTFQRAPGAVQPAYSLTDAQISYSPPSGAWTVDFHIKNIEDNAVRFDALATPAAGRTAGFWASPLPPRTYGVGFRAKF